MQNRVSLRNKNKMRSKQKKLKQINFKERTENL